MRNLETELLNSAIEKQQAGQPFRTRHAALAFKELADNSNSLHLLNRYEARFNREFTRTLRLYLQLHQPDNLDNQTNPIPLPDALESANEPPNQPEPAAPAASSATEQGEGCVSPDQASEEARGEAAPLRPTPDPRPPLLTAEPQTANPCSPPADPAPSHSGRVDAFFDPELI